MATIRIDAKEQVWVNGKRVDAKRTDGTLAISPRQTYLHA